MLVSALLSNTDCKTCPHCHVSRAIASVCALSLLLDRQLFYSTAGFLVSVVRKDCPQGAELACSFHSEIENIKVQKSLR